MKLIVEPDKKSTRNHFCATTPAHSVALDGYVVHAPIVNTETKHFNFDHHAGVDRLATKSTMGQVYFAIKQGLFDCLSHTHGRMYVNDADQDVCISSWLLNYHETLKDEAIDEQMKKLIAFQEPLDVMGGMYALDPNDGIAKTNAWIFEPYVKANVSRALKKMDGNQMEELIRSVWKRIFDYTQYNAQQVDLDTRYSVLGGGKGWSMIEEIGYYARMQLMLEGVEAFVSVKQLDQDVWQYSIGKKSPFIDFPITKLYPMLTDAEGIPDNIHGWGGSDLIGGSSKKYHSALSPQEVEKIINDTLKK